MQASRNNVERVEEIWKEMKTYGIKPDVISYGTLMKANTDDAERVEELWKEMIESGKYLKRKRACIAYMESIVD